MSRSHPRHRGKFDQKILRRIAEKFPHIDFAECIRDPVRVDLGVEGQLIDQPVHLNGFIIDRPDVPVHLLGCVRDSVHDSLDVTLDCRDRRFQVMGNVRNQLPVLPVDLQLLLVGLQQLLAHVLKVLAELPHFLCALRLQLELKITVPDVARCILQMINRPADPVVKPEAQNDCGNREHDQHADDRV